MFLYNTYNSHMRKSLRVDSLKQFGKQVRLLRKSQELSQEDLAEKAGLHSTYIGGIERGERNLSLKSIDKIAKALRTDIREFFLPQLEKRVSEDVNNIISDIFRVLIKKEVADLRLIRSIIKDIDKWLSESKK